MYRRFKPISAAIQQAISAETGRPATVRLKIFKTYHDGLNALVEGTVDFVRFGPASYVRAKERNGGIRLLAMEHKGGKKRFRGVIIVPEESPIQGLHDLKSRTFAFGDENSTIGGQGGHDR
jgi:phosphonate transport system substrate-binding protein